MTERIDIKLLDFDQDSVGAWYYKYNDMPYTGSAYQIYPNGIMASEGNFLNGYQEGIQRYFYLNGQLKSEENFSNNIQHGLCKTWSENGTLIYEGEFDMGKTIWSKIYNEQGDLIRKFPTELI